MKIIFFGSSDFSLSVLEALCLSRHKVIAVVTAEDKEKGRGRKLSFPPAKIFACRKNLTVLQPRRLKDNKFIQMLKKKQADLFVVCDYGKILPEEVLRIPGHFSINLHTSLLPKYRGGAPINWALINGERETGLTVFKMDEHMDRGEIILQQKVEISETDTAPNLKAKLADSAGAVLLRAVDLIAAGKAEFIKQDESRASFAPKLKKGDGLINWGLSAAEIHNRIRALQPWPGSFTYFRGKLLKIWESRVLPDKAKLTAGQITQVDSEQGILVQAGKDRLLITSLQLEGKKRVTASEFISGYDVKVGERLEEGEQHGDS